MIVYVNENKFHIVGDLKAEDAPVGTLYLTNYKGNGKCVVIVSDKLANGKLVLTTILLPVSSWTCDTDLNIRFHDVIDNSFTFKRSMFEDEGKPIEQMDEQYIESRIKNNFVFVDHDSFCGVVYIHEYSNKLHATQLVVVDKSKGTSTNQIKMAEFKRLSGASAIYPLKSEITLEEIFGV